MIGVTILVVKQMKNVWINTNIDLPEGRESNGYNEDIEEVKKKTVILVAKEDDGVHATFEQDDTRNITIV